MPRSLYTTTEVAQARLVVTYFDTIIAENGVVEAAELRDTAWAILLADHAARRIETRRALLRQVQPSGDAA